MISTVASITDVFFKTRTDSSKPVRNKAANFFKSTFSILNRKERIRFSLLIIADIIISIVDILSLALLLWVVQFYIQAGKVHTFTFLPGWMLNRNSVSFIALFFFLFSIKNLAAYFIVRAQHNLIGEVGVRISQNNLLSYQTSEFDEFVNIDSSVHLRNIGYQPFDFCLYVLSGIQQIITQSSLIVLTIVAIILFNAKLFLLLLLILLPPVIIVFYFIKKRLAKDRLEIKTSNQKSFQYLMDALKGYVEGNIYDRNNFFLKRFVAQRKLFSFHLFNSISLQALPGRLIETFAVMGLFILIVIAQWSRATDSGALITIGAFMAAAYKIIPGIVKIVNTVGQIKAHEISFGDISKIDIGDYEEAKAVAPVHSIEFDSINFQYNGSPLLSNLSFSINRGDFVGIEGRSGKGKTTIMNLMLGFLSPACGKISINDSQVTETDIKKYWPSISYVRQQAFFIHDTILRNITLEEESYAESKLQSAIKISGLQDLIDASSEGINKIITENGKNISGGQQQRIALARALYKDADVILLDEPFNELDEASELSLLHHFRELADSGKMIVMITHNRKALSFCNKTVSLDE
jgi:ABC-type bacteriocin/lantibiotic exporter with double-glycine peptidase domain